MVQLPGLSVKATAVAAGVGVALLVEKAALGETNTFWERLGSEACGILASVALASAGLNEIVRWWQRRFWKRQTAFIVFGIIRQIIDELARIATAAFGVLQPATPADVAASVIVPAAEDLRGAFFVPESDLARESYGRLSSVAHSAGDALHGSVPEDVRQEVLEAARAAAPGITRRAERVRDLVTELTAYREHEAARLQKAAIDLRQSAGQLEELSGSRSWDRGTRVSPFPSRGLHRQARHASKPRVGPAPQRRLRGRVGGR